jgi:glycosyltransferase involved in cell wall biosynthesis
VLHDKLFQVVLYTADVVIVLSESMERDLRRRFSIPSATRIVQVPISVPLPAKQKDWSGIQHRSVVFGIVSRLDQAKGIHLALEGLSQVREHQPARLVIFGDGPYKSELQNIAVGLGLQDVVEFRGWTDDTASAMREIDCALLPSFSEGTPRSILEAASVGVPTIATRVGGVADIVKDNLTGWLVPVGDREAIRAKMLWVARTPEVLQAAGEEARAYIERRLSNADEISAILSK